MNDHLTRSLDGSDGQIKALTVMYNDSCNAIRLAIPFRSRACFTIESACGCNATRNRIALQSCLYTGCKVGAVYKGRTPKSRFFKPRPVWVYPNFQNDHLPRRPRRDFPIIIFYSLFFSNFYFYKLKTYKSG